MSAQARLEKLRENREAQQRVEEERKRKQLEEEAQRKQQEDQAPCRPRTKMMSHHYDDKAERQKKFKHDAPAWERR